MTGKITVGADEAGRGLIIGPMIIGACAVDESVMKEFKLLGIKDSKKYSSRTKLKMHAEMIKEKALAWSIKVLTAKDLNNYNKNGLTMDEAEAYAFFRALENINEKVGKIDTFQVDNFQAVKLLRKLLKQNSQLKDTKLVVSIRAETKYIAVSAGSILARDKALSELLKIKQHYGDFGSGSTSDKRTINWLTNYFQKYGSWPADIVRTYWKTIEEIEERVTR